VNFRLVDGTITPRVPRKKKEEA
ncbi:MAG: hypothetical protein RL173_2901, partial [Fibrobacterota bacterium]